MWKDLRFIKSEVNLGSAGGFSIGLEEFYYNTDADFCLLLDDDNMPTDETIENLIAISKDYENLHVPAAYMCVREDREYLKNVANGRKVGEYFFSITDCP